MSALTWLLSLLALAGAGLHVVAALRLRGHLREETRSRGHTPPLTFWRALKVGVPALEQKLEAMVAATRADDQILLGADAASAEWIACEKLRAQFPEREIVVVPCEPNRALNPKISKFVQMQPHARHDGWLLTDSEADLDYTFVEAFRREWAERGVDVLTAGYRFEGAQSWPQRFDAAPVLLTLWPGLMLAPRLDFTLGACTAVRALEVNLLGGWASLGAQLAEDRELGARLAAAGNRVALSRQVLSLAADDMHWWAWLKHQHRVAVTYRAATPLGTLGLPILHTYGLAALGAIAGGVWVGLVLFATVLSLRFLAAWAMARLLEVKLEKLGWLVVFVPFAETFFWLLAWLPLPVWWAGKWRRVGWRGQLR